MGTPECGLTCHFTGFALAKDRRDSTRASRTRNASYHSCSLPVPYRTFVLIQYHILGRVGQARHCLVISREALRDTGISTTIKRERLPVVGRSIGVDYCEGLRTSVAPALH